jgi:hypothetical protein
MAKKYDVAAKVGTYEKNGQTKGIYKNVGSVFETKNGLSMKLAAWFNPSALEVDSQGEVWLSLFEPKQNNQQAPSSPVQQDIPNDDIPF